ncbi:MAG: hypothetical protein V4723_05830 [Pseudomonadota bacterium]
MDETDDFIDEPEIDSPALEQTQLWSGFGDDVAQRFLRLRGIMDEHMQEEALERHARRQALPRVPAAITFAVRSAILTASQGSRVHNMPVPVLASSAAR